MNEKEAPEKTLTLGSTGETARTIGPYRLLQKIGEGGMGEVWVAEQHKPIHRRVALKLIKAGMDTKQVLARFESERQALAMMDHPAIAKVLEAGETAEGRPYFVMEYVQGIPITRHCDQNRLTTRERLALFMRVCEGVQHAHQKAVIHRDLKPSNILVAIQDGKAVPKIIDFGVAKATAQSLTERTMYTELGMLIGTPEYMSPEQAEMSGQNVDTRTDVYSLGAILYELLVGALPFDPKELRRAGFDGIRRKIREEDPPKPSTKLSTMGETLTTQAQNRRTESPALVRQIRGDLDWITMKALEKDRTRRFGSPSELAADIDRYLNNQPIVARPPSTAYRAQKFVRRHRIGVGVATAMALLLVVFSFVTALQARRIARERDRANREAEASLQVSDFLTGLFKVSDPSEARGNSVTAREILDKGADKITRELQGQPLVQGKLMNTIGSVYMSLGLYDQSQGLLEKALEIRRKALGPDHPVVAVTLADLGTVALHKGDFVKAKTLQEQALEINEKRFGPNSKEVGANLHGLGNVYFRWAKYDEGLRVLEQALAIREKLLGPDSPDVANTLNSMGAILYMQGSYKKARAILERALAIREKALAPDHPDLARTLNNLGLVCRDSGEFQRAIPLLERVVQIQEKVLGPMHPDLASGLVNLGDCLNLIGNTARAKGYYARAVEIMETAAPNNPELARFLDRLATVALAEKDVKGAQGLYERSLALRRKALGPKSPDVASSLAGLADCAYQSGRLKEAESLYEQALAVARKPDGSYYPGADYSLNRLASMRRDSQKDAPAGRVAKETEAPGTPERIGPVQESTTAVLNKMIDAQGGRKYLESIKDTTLIGVFEMTQAGMSAKITIYTKEPNKIRMETEIMDMVMSQGYDGQKGWFTNPQTGSAEELPEAAAKDFARQALANAALLDPAKWGITYKLKWKAKLEDKEYIVMERIYADGKTATIYIDPVTYLVYKEETSGMGQTGAEVKIESYTTDYMKEGEGMVCHAFRNLTDGAEVNKVTVTTVTYNTDLKDSLFSMPK